MKQRDRTLDIAKGIAMILVVSYHIILSSPETEKFFAYICGVLGFFTFAAGYTYRPGRRNFKESAVNRVRGMMIPYLRISFMMLTFSCLYYHATRGGDWRWFADQYVFTYLRGELTEMIWPGYFRPDDLPYSLVSPGWYIWMIFFASLLFYAVADRVLVSRRRLLAAVVAGGAVSYGLLERNIALPWGMQCAPVYAAMMLLGAWAGQRRLLDFEAMSTGRKFFLTALAVAVFGISLHYGLVEKTFRGQFRELHTYADSIIAFLALGLADSFLLLELSYAIGRHVAPLASRLALFGEGTIFTLLNHGFFSLILFDRFSLPCKFELWVRDYTPREFWISVVVFVVTVLKCFLILRIRAWLQARRAKKQAARASGGGS